jgi:hypothetical protein
LIWYPLPDAVEKLFVAREELRLAYKETGLGFTFDGNLVGDIGEAIAASHYGVILEKKSVHDGMYKNFTVQIKATGTCRGPNFRYTETGSHYLLFFDIDFEKKSYSVFYNGIEAPVRKILGHFSDQRQISRKQLNGITIEERGTEIPRTANAPEACIR